MSQSSSAMQVAKLLALVILTITITPSQSTIQIHTNAVRYYDTTFLKPGAPDMRCYIPITFGMNTTSSVITISGNGVGMGYTLGSYVNNYYTLDTSYNCSLTDSLDVTFVVKNQLGELANTTINLRCLNPYQTNITNIKYYYSSRSLTYHVMFQGMEASHNLYTFKFHVDYYNSCYKIRNQRFLSQTSLQSSDLTWYSFDIFLVPLAGMTCNYSEIILIDELITGTTINILGPIPDNAVTSQSTLLQTELVIPPLFRADSSKYAYTAIQSIQNYKTEYRIQLDSMIAWEPVEGNLLSGNYASTILYAYPLSTKIYRFDPLANITNLASYSLTPVDNTGNFTLGGQVGLTVFNCSDLSVYNSFLCRVDAIYSTVNKYTQIVFDSSSIAFDLVPPYGIGSGTLQSYKFNAAFVFSPYYKSSQLPFTIWMNKGATLPYYMLKPANLPTDTVEPFVKSVTIIPLTVIDYLLIVGATDDKSGIYDIQLEKTTYRLTQSDMVSGSSTDAVFEKVVQIHPSILGQDRGITLRIRDQAMRMYTYSSNRVLSSGLIFPPVVPKCQWSITNITYISFKYPTIDVTNLYATNTLYIKVANPDRSLEPMIELFYKQNLDGPVQWTGYFNPYIDMYQIDFILPKNIFEGVLNYTILSFPPLSYDYLNNYFGQNATLRISSNNADILPPYIKSIQAPSTYTPVVGGVIIVKVNIIDNVNGFDHGFINFTLELDPEVISMPVTQSNLVSGTIYNGEYQINIPMGNVNCTSQLMTLSGSTMYDTAGNIGYSWTPSKLPMYDPLRLVLNSTARNISIQCMGAPNPFVTPSVINPSFSSINVGAWPLNRKLFASFDVSQLEHISRTATPYLYLSTLYGEYVRGPCNLTLYPRYDCSVDVPFGFGYAGTDFIASIYGVSDTFNNLGSHNYSSVVRDYIPLPYLESVFSKVTSNGGQITLIGRQLQSITQVKSCFFLNGQNCTITGLQKVASTMIIVGVQTPITQPSLQINVQGQSTPTNLLYVPISASIVIPQPMTCPNECSGHGECDTDNGECKCEVGFSGIDCSSVVIDVPGVINGSSPIYTSNNTDISSIISLVAIQERDLNDKIVNRFPFTTWNSTIVSGTNPLYEYTTLLQNRSTRVNVTIQQFTVATSVSFAGDTTIMIPHTTKFSISLDKYQFQSNLNYLELVMSVVVSREGSSCSSSAHTTQGQSSDYMRLYVSKGVSLFGKFIKKGVIDERVVTVKNTFIDTSTPDSITQLIALGIPNYKNGVLLDPQFNYLVGNSNDGEIGGCDDTSSKKLSVRQIVGIVVGVILFVFIVTAVSIFLVKRKFRIVRKGKVIELVSIYTKQ